ncbi:restriction endonuclease [Nostoc sp.]|uniref:restriction endonuclease n=1 Tax=Nostoc sp. TaxID=1180 RepID=UPI002FF62C5B
MNINFEDLNLMFKMLIPDSLSKKEKGDFFEAVTAHLFRQRGLKVTQNVRLPGVQIDIELEDEDTNEKSLVECKFHKDKIGSDEVGKIISILSTYDFSRGFLLSASELEGESKTFANNFNKKHNNKLTVWAGKDLIKIFKSAYGIQNPDLDRLGNIGVSRITFLVTYEKEFIWVVEQIDTDIENSHAFIFPTKFTRNHSVDYWKSYFDHFNIYQKYNLKFLNENNQKSNISQLLNIQREHELKKVVISRIRKADKFVDYHLPCSPEDFFGRVKPKEIFWQFIKDVRDKKPDSRIVCLTGNTGLGKSSLLVKLIEESCQEQYKHEFYIRDVDVTSVRDDKAKFFLANVIQTTLQEAIDDKFIKITNHKIKLDSLEYPFFESDSIQLLRHKLREERKVIIIFFDQFEEILTNNSWVSIYNDFLEVAQEINYIKENIVFGFSWRADIYLPAKSPQSEFWYQIKHLSTTIDLNNFIFSEEDTAQALKKFENFLIKNTHIKKLDFSIKKWLLDNCQNMPWLLKKICGEIHKDTLKSVDFKSKQIINNIDIIKKIFDRDIDEIKNIGNIYYDCLKDIAELSPISQQEVIDKYECDVIHKLLEYHLIIATGSNYKIYADIFREYIVDDELPLLTINFTPRTSIVTALKIFKLLNSNLTKLEVDKNLNLKSQGGTINNALQDLQKFLPLETQQSSGLVKIPNNINKLNDYQIAEIIADYLESHVLIQEIYREYQPNQCFHYDDFDKILLKNRYVSSSRKPKDYRSRFLSWFCFAGLLEIRQDEWIYRPINSRKGKHKGNVSDCEFRNKRRKDKSKGKYRQLNALDLLEQSLNRSQL